MPFLGQHRNSGRTASRILHCERRRVGNLGQGALARTGPLDLRDHRNSRTPEPRHRIDGGVYVLTPFLEAIERNPMLLNCQILPDPGNDVV